LAGVFRYSNSEYVIYRKRRYGIFKLWHRIKQRLNLPDSDPAKAVEEQEVFAAQEQPETGRERRAAFIGMPPGRPFHEFDLHPNVHRGIQDAGFKRCTPIQDRCLPLSLQGRDIAGQAHTGTGKTAAFLITVFERLLRLEDRDPKIPSALIIAPTRELSLQIYRDAQILGAHTGLSMVSVFGGVDYEKQARQLKAGADVIIGTPGRIIDYMKQRILKTKQIRILVIDEADRMFDMGFIRDLRYILRRLPPFERRQSMLFSATLSYRVLELAYEFMYQPEEVYIEPEEKTVETVEQSVFHVGLEEKLSLLLGILKNEDWHRVLIFCNTKAGVEYLTRKLRGNGHPAEGITGDLPQRKRLHLMDGFKSGKLKILVATDVASRGIHVEDVSHVINYDVPQDREDYVHRIGRTARAGRTGKALTLADDRGVWHLQAIEEFIDQKVPVTWFDQSWLEPDRSPPQRRTRRKQKSRESGPPKRDKGRRPAKKQPRRTDGDSSQKSSAAGGASKRRRRRRRKPQADQTKDTDQQAPVQSS
jgi:ATP-dependent RNA helicase RhlB